jgi:hypothetical protein
MKFSDNIQLELTKEEAYALFLLLQLNIECGEIQDSRILSEQSDMLVNLKNLIEGSVCQSKW